MRSVRLVLTSVAFGLLGTAVSSCGSVPARQSAAEAAGRIVFLGVNNRSEWQVEIFAELDQQRLRLGQAGPTSTASLQFSRNQLLDSQRVRLIVVAIGGDSRWRSDYIELSTVTEVVLHIPPVLSQSYFTVR